MADNRLLQQGIPSSLRDALYQTGRNALLYPFRNPETTAEFGLSMAPGSGEAMSARDAWDASGRAAQAVQSGDWGNAASEYGNLAAALAGAIPGLGIVARGTKRGAAWMDRNLPAGVNRLLDGITPSDPRNTTFSGAGPTADLPMDEASRMARAKELGYAGQPFYRGEASGNAYAGGPAFFSRDQEYAAGFAKKGGQDAPAEYRLNLGNTFSDRAPMRAADYGRLVEAAAASDPKLAADLAESIAPGKGVEWLIGFSKAQPDFVVVEPGGASVIRHAIERGSADPMRLFRAAGYDALDSGRDVRKIAETGIRSKDAAFDPSKAASGNIMAGLAGAAMLPAWLLSQDATLRPD